MRLSLFLPCRNLSALALSVMLTLAVGCKSESGQASASASTAVNTSTPVAEVAVDGKITDWAAIEEQMPDAQADSAGTEVQELTGLRVAVNGNTLYLLMSLKGDATFPHAADADSSYYGATLTSYRAAACTKANKISGYQVAQVKATGSTLAANLIDYSGAGVASASTDILIGAKGGNLEFALPLSQLPAKAVAFTLVPKIWSLTGEVITLYDKNGAAPCFAL